MKAAAIRQGFQTGKVHELPCFASDAGPQELVPPVRLPHRFTGPGHRVVGGKRLGGNNIVNGLNDWGRNSLNTEGVGHTLLAGVYQRLVVQGFLRGMSSYGSINGSLGHAFLDFGIVGNGVQSNVGHGPVVETTPHAFTWMGS